MLSASVTKSGFQVRLWTKAVVQLLVEEGNVQGPAICDNTGYLLSTSEVDTEFHSQLQVVKDSHPELFPGVTDVETEFGISQSFRRGSTSRAIAEGLKEEVDAQNRWRKTEMSEGSMPYGSMRQHYSDLRLLAPVLIPYSKAM